MVDMYGVELRVGDKVQSRLAFLDYPREHRATTPVCTIRDITADYVLIDCHLCNGGYDRSQVKPSFMSKCYAKVECDY